MFYSEAILSKKGPLAKVWLAAHWERKLSKAQFLQTNIQTSVGAILGGDQPPMALRLSGQLLLGVVRIYSRKAKYLLDDCNEALHKIKMAFRPGEVDLVEEQRIANFESITLPDNITEFDILLPDPSLNIKQWTDITPVATTSSSNISRPQDITIRDNFDVSLTSNIGDDLLGDAFDTEDGRGLDLNLDDELFDSKAHGHDARSESNDGSIDIEMARDAQPELSMTIEDVIGSGSKNAVEDDPLMIIDDGPELNLMDDNLLDDNLIEYTVDMPTLDIGRPSSESLETRPLEIDVNLDTNVTNMEDQTVQETMRFTPLSPRSPEQEVPELFQDEVIQPTTPNRRKRKLIVDEVTELPNRHIANQIKDTSDILITPSFLQASRNLLRIGEIRQTGASYYLDLNVPHNLMPQFHHLFARKRLRMTPSPPPEDYKQEEAVQAGPSRVDNPINEEFTEHENNNTYDDLDFQNAYNSPILDHGSVVEEIEKGKEQEKTHNTDKESVAEQNLATPVESTSEHDDAENNFDMISHHENDNALDITSPIDDGGESSSSRGITIFDQDEPQDQQATGNESGYSKNTVKAMRLLRDKCRGEISDRANGKSKSPVQVVVSYDSVVGTAKRQDAVKLFFELLVLNTKDVIHVKQNQPYGDIEILCKDKLFDLLEEGVV
ncbi:3567_t:CDS:10 [Dentiscutata erythropus]|uniref:3567_t:CDS:1 n=1 Tax=Dentiscutata erythropus TaxID=1348616 RepID=A0A9N9CX96_9GLOM|nr:3567_t:CDS:10 [Dentiscutata erythropus]